MTTALRPVPADFAQHADEPFSALRQRYGCGTSAITRWIKETGVYRPRSKAEYRPAAIPDDFVELWPVMARAALAKHYSRSANTIAMWEKELGLSRPQSWRSPEHAKGARKAIERVQKARKAAPKQRGLVLIAVDRFTRDLSQAGQAADYLRRFGPVVRCDEKGKYKADGQHWRRGSTILTADEVIARAQRNGWNPDSWRQVA